MGRSVNLGRLAGVSQNTDDNKAIGPFWHRVYLRGAALFLCLGGFTQEMGWGCSAVWHLFHIVKIHTEREQEWVGGKILQIGTNISTFLPLSSLSSVCFLLLFRRWTIKKLSSIYRNCMYGEGIRECHSPDYSQARYLRNKRPVWVFPSPSEFTVVTQLNHHPPRGQ